MTDALKKPIFYTPITEKCKKAWKCYFITKSVFLPAI